MTDSWLIGDLSFAWQAAGVAIAVVILFLIGIVVIDLVQLYRAQPVGQLFPDGAEERSIPHLLPYESDSPDGDGQAMIGVSVTTRVYDQHRESAALKPNSPRPADDAQPASGSSDSRSRNHSALMAAGQTEAGSEPAHSHFPAKPIWMAPEHYERKALDKANFAASHAGTVIDIQTRKRA
jgi:hypothetical protein